MKGYKILYPFLIQYHEVNTVIAARQIVNATTLLKFNLFVFTF